jgi:hypothetical protein
MNPGGGGQLPEFPVENQRAAAWSSNFASI